MAKKTKRKTTKHFHFFIHKSFASPTGARLGNGSCDQSKIPLCHSFLLKLFPGSSMGSSAGKPGSPPPALPLGISETFLTFFLTILAVGSAGFCCVQQGAALAARAWTPLQSPQTGFITRAPKAANSLGNLGNTHSCNLSSGR